MHKRAKKENTVRNIIITLALTILPLQVFTLISRDTEKVYYQSVMFIIAILLTAVAVKITGRPRNLTLNTGNMKMVFTKEWYVIAAGLVFAVLNFMNLDLSNTPSLSKTVFFFSEILLGVIFEELVFRGVIQNMLVEKYESLKQSAWKAIIIASSIFALMHLLNLIRQPYFVLGTVTQVVYAFCLGTMLGVVYYHSQNIWTVILLHLIFNVLGSYSSLFITVESNSDISFMGAALQLVIMLPGLFAARVIHRKSAQP